MDYEAFTREKIARLRADADALERHLKEFLAASARASGTAIRGRRSQEGSAIGAILEAIDAAGPEGMTLDQMIQFARERGHDVKRNTLRSQLWTAKQENRVVQLEPGRYATASPPLGLELADEDDVDPFAPEDDPRGSHRMPSTFVVKPRPRPVQPASKDDLDDEIPF